MAVPTIVSVTPGEGHSGGKTLVEITGTDFQLYPAPPPTGPTTPALFPPMRVLFGGRPASAIAVVSSTQLYCLTPFGDEAPVRAAGPGGDPVGPVLSYGAVDVQLDNLDTAGVPIAGETVTSTAAYTFRRPDLSVESVLSRVVRMILRELKRQIIPNVNFATHTDYDATTGDMLNLAYVEELPALILSQVEIPENRGEFAMAPGEFPADAGRFISRRPPVVVDVNMILVGVSNDPIELLNLMQACRVFFQKNPYLYVDRDALDPTKGTVRFPMMFSFSGPVSVSRQGDNTNVQSFAGPIKIVGVLLEDMPGITTEKPPGIPDDYPHEATQSYGYVAEDAVVDAQKKG